MDVYVLSKRLKMARAQDCRPYRFVFKEFITGHHVYKDVWTPSLGEELCCEREPNNPRDKHAVKVVKNTETVGHVPRAISPYMTYILANGGEVTVKVIGKRENARGNGLEVPGLYTVKGPYHRRATRLFFRAGEQFEI